LGVGGVCIGAMLVGHFTKDTWESDNAAKIHMLADEAKRLDTGADQRAALAKYQELADFVGSREIKDEELKEVVEAAKGRHHTLQSALAAEIAREREEARRREHAEQERRRREKEARAREEQQRREEAERRAAAETLKLSAYLMSQEFVKERLKAPSSARFPEYASLDVTVLFDEETRKYTVMAWVEAQNPLGVYLRSTYTCRLWPAGGDLWRSDLTHISNP
jgi:murein DD-endopeptidase MepM/ murein hydrolase activator NlpD